MEYGKEGKEVVRTRVKGAGGGSIKGREGSEIIKAGQRGAEGGIGVSFVQL